MEKQIHALILGFETPNGQWILKRLKDNFPSLKIGIPAGIYSEDIKLAPYILPVNFSNAEQLAQSFQKVQTIVSCDPKFINQTITSAAKIANSSFINACYSYPKTVIESAFYKFSFTPNTMTACQSASGLGFQGFWILSHQKSMLSRPKKLNGKWEIEQPMIDIGKLKVTHLIEFSSPFFAYCFWFFAILFRFLIPLFKDTPVYSSVCNWRFYGETSEHSQKYEYLVTSQEVHAERLRPDLAIKEILQSIGINENESSDWNCFNFLKVTLVDYKLIQ